MDPAIDGAMGMFVADKQGSRILLYPYLDESHATEVILHELVHALDYHFGFGLSHKQVHGLGTALAQSLAPYIK